MFVRCFSFFLFECASVPPPVALFTDTNRMKAQINEKSTVEIRLCTHSSQLWGGAGWGGCFESTSLAASVQFVLVAETPPPRVVGRTACRWRQNLAKKMHKRSSDSRRSELSESEKKKGQVEKQECGLGGGVDMAAVQSAAQMQQVKVPRSLCALELR